MPSKTRKAAAQASYQQGERKNLIYNGDMAICQRAISVSGVGDTDTGYHVQDRWGFVEAGTNSATVVTMSKSTTTPDGFYSSLKMECTTPSGTLSADDLVLLQQVFEGQDLQSINKGDAQAKAITISFWVNTTQTGTYIVNLFDNDNTRVCSQSYTVSSSNTWEYKTVTFPPDTTGAFDNDENASLYVYWGLVCGTNYTSSGTLQETWAANDNTNRFVGQVNAFASTSNLFHLTGVQMELGNTATDFQYESHKENLARCQRYFVAYGGTGTDSNDYVVVGSGVATATSGGWLEVNPPTPMRIRPSITFANMYLFDASNRTLASIDYVSVEDSATVYRPKTTLWLNAIRTNSTTDLTVGRGMQLYTDNAENSYFWMNADF